MRTPLESLFLTGLLAGLALAPACTTDPDADDADDSDALPGQTIDEASSDDKADAPAELRARVDGMTVWMDPIAVIGNDNGTALYVIEGRTSRNLASVQSWVPDDAFGSAEIVSPRKFRLTLRNGHEHNTMLSGLPLFVTLRPTTGATAQAAVWLAPRVTSVAGSSSIYLGTGAAPVWVDGDVVYRGSASLYNGYSGLAVRTSAGAGPMVTPGAAGKAQLDWRFDALGPVIAAWGAPPITATATKGATTATKSARIEVRVAKLGLTLGNADTTWPRVCTDAVMACLQGLGATATDAGACGTFRQVSACGGPAAATIAPATLAEDLRSWLAYWYVAHGGDVAAAGGNTLAQAQAAVDPAAFVELHDAEEDPHGNDLGVTRVFRHPDPVFPGSDTAWFSAYEKSSGGFLESYDFN